jgi:hypothetical protein
MALPRTHQASLTPHELEFIAEEDTIDIVPLISMAPLRLLSVRQRLPPLSLRGLDRVADLKVSLFLLGIHGYSGHLWTL